jgi:hypothetical protein
MLRHPPYKTGRPHSPGPFFWDNAKKIPACVQSVRRRGFLAQIGTL